MLYVLFTVFLWGNKLENRLKKIMWEFLGCLVVRIPHFHCCSPGSVLVLGTEIP